MGTEVQGKMYLPGYYSMGELNDATSNGTWPPHHENKTFGQYHGMFSTRPATDEYIGYDREQFRQTILTHETIFRHQLHELHRLHKIQLDMMTEVRSKELHRHLNPMPMGISQSSLFAFPSADDRKRWHDSSSPLVDFNRHIHSTSAADSIQSHFSPKNVETMQSGYGSTHNGSRFKDHDSLESKCKKLERRLFDLELPADKYINDEDESRGASGGSREKYPSNWNYKVNCEKGGIVSTQNGACSSCNGDALSSNMFFRRAQGFADLNEPIQVEEASGTASVDILGNITCSKKGIQRWDLSANSCSDFPCLAKEISQSSYKGKEEEIRASNLHLDNEKQNGWLPYTVNPGQTMSNRSSLSGGFPYEYLPAPRESSQVGCKKAHEPVQTKNKKWGKKTIFGVEISERNHETSVMASDKLLLQPHVPQSTVANSESSSISSWKKLPVSSRQELILVQGNPSFNTFPDVNKGCETLMHAPEVTRDWSHENSNLRSVPCLGAEPSYKHSPCSVSHLDSKEVRVCYPLVGVGYLNGNNSRNSASEQVPQYSPTNNFRGSGWLVNKKSAEELNLNAVPPKSYQNKAGSDSNLISIDGLRENETPQRGLPWLRNISPCNGKSFKERDSSHQVNLDSMQNYSQQFVSKTEKMKGPSQSLIQDSSSVTNDSDTEDRRIESGDCSSNRKILGLSISEKHMCKELPSSSSALKPSCASEINGANSVKVGLLHTDLNHDPMPSESGEIENMKSLVVEKGSVGCSSNLRHYIDLNVSVTEEEVQPTHISPRTKVKIAVEIDLEAPVVVETEISITSKGEFLERKHKGPSDSLKDESTDIHEGFMKVAAEALVDISSSGVHNPPRDNATCQQLEHSLSDSLEWFAEIISSYKGDVEIGVGLVGRNSSDCEDSIPNGVDYFEHMTLNLTEAKIEKCNYKPLVLENTKDEVTLPRRPRRGQARRGRQRKDFQRDILPGLVSLSRNDVTEDLQTIEGLIRATGGTWQSGLSQRNSPKNKGGRGRKRSVVSATPPAATAVSPPEAQQPKYGEPGVEETGLTGWGKRTRRPPRQRYPINPPPFPIL